MFRALYRAVGDGVLEWTWRQPTASDLQLTFVALRLPAVACILICREGKLVQNIDMAARELDVAANAAPRFAECVHSRLCFELGDDSISFNQV